MSKHTKHPSGAALEKHLKDDTFISEVYQDIPCPEPSPHLNQAIITAAGKHNRTSLWWRQPSSWAATIVIFSLVGMLTYHTLEQEKDTASSMEPVYSPSPVTAVLSDNKSDNLSDKSSKQPVSQAKVEADTKPYVISVQEKTQHLSQPAPEPQAAEFRARSAFKAMHKNDTRQLNFARQPLASEESFAGETATEQTAPAFSPALSAEQLLKQIQLLIQSKDFKQAAVLLQQLQENYPQQPVDPVILKQLAPWQRTTKP